MSVEAEVAIPHRTTEESDRDGDPVWVMDPPQYLLFLVICVIIWTFGFIELLNRTSEIPAVFGLYSARYFAILVGYTSGYLVWAALIARPSRSGWLTRSISFVQKRWWLALGLLALAGVLIWNLVTVKPFIDHPLEALKPVPFVRFTIVGYFVLACGLIVFGGWEKTGLVPVWRKIVAALLAVVIGIELIFQVLANAGLLPGNQRIDNLYVPSARIYQNVEGLGNGRTNNYGWYYPNFKLRSESERILILGDTFIEALQIDREDHLGATLDSLLATSEPEANTEVLALGFPGFGPAVYLRDTSLEDSLRQFEPREIILFFHLGNDFQYASNPTPNDMVYVPDDEVGAVVHPDGQYYLHNLQHYVWDGYFLLVDPLATLAGNYLTVDVLANLAADQDGVPDAFDIPGYRGYIADQIETDETFAFITETGLASVPGKSNFMFQKDGNAQAEQALIVADGLLRATKTYLDEAGVGLRIVTIPVFPPAFYAEMAGDDWSPEIGEYDLFGPEEALRDIAREHDIPILPLGRYMQEQGLTVDEIKAFYFVDGLGHLTPQGHDFVGHAVHDCFYSSDPSTAPQGCGDE